jgi:8-oxo-dGTP pyrophosphatase MutT (NUDIX family)
MIFYEKPVGFKGRREVATCFIECRGEFLLLLRHPYLPELQAGKWGLPGGVVEQGEFADQAIWRELTEETGINVQTNEPVYIHTLYVQYDDEHGKYEFVLHLFRLSRHEKPNITIDHNEHADFCWATPYDALRMNLMKDLEKFIELRYPQGV